MTIDTEQITARLRELGLVEMYMPVGRDGSFGAELNIQGHRIKV